MQSEYLIRSLLEQTAQIITEVEKLKAYDLQFLTWKENETSWSILECLEHLNLYGHFYLPQIESKLKHTTTRPELEFKSGILGNYFSKSMLPKDKLNKMKTFKDKNPLHAKLGKAVIDEFLNQQIRLQHLLDQSRKVSLNKVKIRTSISALIQLKLGDTYKFFVNHIIRHLKQIERIQQAVKEG